MLYQVYLKRHVDSRVDVTANDATEAAEMAVAYAKHMGWSARKVLTVEAKVWRPVVTHFPATDEYEA